MSNRRASYLILLTCLALLKLLPQRDLQLWAQSSTATVSGSVADSTGALIAEVTVSLTNIGTRVVSTGTTNSSGLYRISSLIPGTYRANVSRDGFKSIIKDGIALHVEDEVSINYSMEVGAVSVSVMVESGQSQVNAESTTVGQVIESRQIEDTPLNGRNVFNLLELVPGVVPQGAASGSPLNNQAAIGNFTNPAGWGNYQIGGGAAGQNAEFVDGAPVSSPIENWLILVPSRGCHPGIQSGCQQR